MIHHEAIHQEIKYACDECDYLGSTKDNLRYQHQSNHQSRKYHCQVCDYTAATKSILTKHSSAASRHKG